MSTNISTVSTPTVKAGPPINILDTNVLLEIFTKNTDIFRIFRDAEPNDLDNNGDYIKDSAPLIVLRRTSQVCRIWRAIILGSPKLWGRVIELNLLQGDHRENWRREILKRAGRSDLHIIGICVEPQFFVELLEKRWENIQRLSVSLTGDPDNYVARIRSCIRSPAPLLEVFELSFMNSNLAILERPDLPFFGDDAPKMRVFSISRPTLEISLKTGWLENLRSLRLYTHARSPRLDGTEIMDLLSKMPFLKDLYLNSSISQPRDEECRIVALPFLEMLSIRSTPKTSLFILKHVTPSQKCALRLHVEFPALYQVRSPESYTEISGICEETVRFVNGYLISLAEQILPDYLSLGVSGDTVCLAQFATPEKKLIHFEIVFSGFGPSFNLSAISTLLAFPDFNRHTTNVKAFRFLAYEYATANRLETVFDPPFDVVGAYFSSFSSVTLLQISVLGLQVLLRMQGRNYDTFPNLQTLELQERMAWLGDRFHRLLADFLTKQIDRGRRLEVLDISDCHSSESNYIHDDWRYLEGFEGLKVVWGEKGSKKHYICGSGRPHCMNVGRTITGLLWH